MGGASQVGNYIVESFVEENAHCLENHSSASMATLRMVECFLAWAQQTSVNIALSGKGDSFSPEWEQEGWG